MRRSPRPHFFPLATFALAAALFAACGSSPTPASYPAAGLCAAPRTGTDPLTRAAFPDRQGTPADEKAWLRAWSDDLYLWYRELPGPTGLDPATFATPVDYFGALKSSATTTSGALRDRFHFTMATADWESFSQAGAEAGYGAWWAFLASRAPRRILVAFTEPGTPAEAAHLARGAQLLAIDGIDAIHATSSQEVAALNAGLTPAAAGEHHTFVVLDPGTTTPRTVPLTSQIVQDTPVSQVKLLTTASGTVGYLQFDEHIATAELGLTTAIQTLANAHVSDLVLDLRYNGGGYLAIASELAYMIAGPARTAGRTFELERFNDKHPTTDPVTGAPLSPMPFYDRGVGLTVPSSVRLPVLGAPGAGGTAAGLSRVYVLSTGGTCSASEAVINGLRGVGVEVVLVGGATCGKPYGFYPQDNCGTTYFSIEFAGVNDRGFGDYSDGFVPTDPALVPTAPSSQVPGCAVADDFSQPLGDPAEALLAAALAVRETGRCPAVAVARAAPPRLEKGPADLPLPGEELLLRGPWREIGIGGLPGKR
jgi:hypothetical protein